MEIFNSVFGTLANIFIMNFCYCIATALGIGLLVTFIYTRHSVSSKSFTATLAVLPVVVCVVILLVNGNIGAGVAVAGAFSLVRFRSAQGSAKEIGAIFLAMGAGLITGMGYLLFSVIFAVIASLAFWVFASIRFSGSGAGLKKSLTVTIPETLDYTHVFDDIFDRFVKRHELTGVKTTNMGSLFKLTYSIDLKDASCEKKLIDSVRERNGNLEVMINRFEPAKAEL